MTNTHNYIWNDYSTKDFSVYLRYQTQNRSRENNPKPYFSFHGIFVDRNWENPFPKNIWGERTDWGIWRPNPLHQWTRVLRESLPDSRGQVAQNVILSVLTPPSNVTLRWRSLMLMPPWTLNFAMLGMLRCERLFNRYALDHSKAIASTKTLLWQGGG